MGKFWDFVVMMANESFPPKPTWTTEDVPDLTGKVIIVTGMFISIYFLVFANLFRIVLGGNSGLGLELTKVRLHGHMSTRRNRSFLATL